MGRGLLVIVGGAPGGGKSHHMSEVAANLKCTRLDKDVVQASLMSGSSSYKDQEAYNSATIAAYRVLLDLADINLKQGNKVVLEGNFGTRLSDPMLSKYFESSDNFGICYLRFSCSDRALQIARVKKRRSTRDIEKLDSDEACEKFIDDRIEAELRELNKVKDILPVFEIDTADESVEAHNERIQAIQSFINGCANELQLDESQENKEEDDDAYDESEYNAHYGYEALEDIRCLFGSPPLSFNSIANNHASRRTATLSPYRDKFGVLIEIGGDNTNGATSGPSSPRASFIAQ